MNEKVLTSDSDILLSYKDIVEYAVYVMYKRFDKNLIDYLKEDLIQEGYISVWSSLKTYDEDEKVPLRKWLLICTIRSMVHFIRKEERYQKRYCMEEVTDYLLYDNSITPLLLKEFLASLTEDQEKILDKLIDGDYIVDIARDMQVRTEIIVNEIKKIKTKLN